MESAQQAQTFEQKLFGRIRDVDSHEMLAARYWVKEYGDFVKPLADGFGAQAPTVPNSFAGDGEDDTPITKGTIAWSAACRAPGAFDMKRRLQVLDVAGIQDTLMFGSAMAIGGLEFASGIEGYASLQLKKQSFDPVAVGKQMLRAHNDWCIKVSSYSSRLRPVAAISDPALKGVLAEAERVIAGGVRGITVATGATLDEKPPCHPDMDVLWRLMADNNVPLLLHIGGEKPFLREPNAWVNCPQFYTNNTLPNELNVDPFSFATCSFAGQNYLTSMILGGVFERVPDLRCGVMELGASWVGALGQNMDVWAEQFARRFKGLLSMKPSEYLHRNVRVSPFTFEPADLYIEQFPYLEDVLCFSTDFPHYEGGKNPIENVIQRMCRLGESTVEKFFVTNAEWVMPS